MQHLWLAAGLAARAYDASSEIVHSHLAKRDGNQTKSKHFSGPLFIILVVLNFIAIFPIIIYMLYTLSELIPTLAVAESHAPEYQQVAPKEDDEWTTGGNSTGGIKLGDEDDEDILEGGSTKVPLYPQRDQQQQIPTLSVEEPVATRGAMSIRKLHKALYRIKGLRSMFHGIIAGEWYALGVTLVTVSLGAVPRVGGPLGYVAGSLLTVQLGLRYRHHQLTAPEPTRYAGGGGGGGAFSAFVFRLPPFRATLRATALPTLLLLAARGVSLYLPALVAAAISHEPLMAFGGFVVPVSSQNGRFATTTETYIGFFGLQLLLLLLLEVPAGVVLLRIQTALLADNDVRTVVPIDRTFGMPGGLFAAERDGTGRGWLSASWLSLVAAFRSFKGQWVKFYLFNLKLLAIVMGIETAIFFVLFLQFGVIFPRL